MLFYGHFCLPGWLNGLCEISEGNKVKAETPVIYKWAKIWTWVVEDCGQPHYLIVWLLRHTLLQSEVNLVESITDCIALYFIPPFTHPANLGYASTHHWLYLYTWWIWSNYRSKQQLKNLNILKWRADHENIKTLVYHRFKTNHKYNAILYVI